MTNKSPYSQKNTEIEAKFSCGDLKQVDIRLQQAGAELIFAESYESNILFDDPAGSLKNEGAILRLRQECGVNLMTWKRSQKKENGIAYREEIETEIADFDQMKLILERIGFQVSFMYEKYRTQYRLGESLIMLDRTPIGCFAEVEGADESSIHLISDLLGLDWQLRTSKSYLQLFREWAAENGSDMKNMVFGAA